MFLTLFSYAQYNLPNSNYVPPSHPLLSIQRKYDNPLNWNIVYGIGMQLGVDWQKNGGAVYNKINAYFTHRGFVVEGSYARDISSASIFSSSNPLVKVYNQPYRQTEISATIHVSDKVKTRMMLPYVGILVLRDEKTVENIYNYEYIQKDKIGEIHRSYKEWKNFHTNQEVSYRFAWGFGGSFISRKTNLIYSSKGENYNLDCITLVDKSANPTDLVMPFNQTVFGAGIHISEFFSYSYTYKLSELRPQKLRRNVFSMTKVEILYGSGLEYGSQVITYQNNQVTPEDVESVSSNSIGFRIKRTTNQIRYSGKKPGLYTEVEAGLRPGIYKKAFTDGLYISFGLGIII
ncbi:MAG: hypothetical protein ACK4EX_00220 [Thermaurantimonas sp.]|uniref:hypothetical protein n=1 Tax=Thermaurantimonas sp. TaxID=2681568 RepID=UPI00391A7A97